MHKFANNKKSGEDVISLNGLYAANPKPISNAENIQGILIFSNNLPSRKVSKNTPAKNKIISIYSIPSHFTCKFS